MRSGGAWFLATAATAAAVPISDLYPMVDFYYANDHRAHPMCEKPSSAEFPSIPIEPVKLKARAWPYRPSVGLRQLSRELMSVYKEQFANHSVSDVKYVAATRRKRYNWEGVKQNALAVTLSNSMSGAAAASVPGAICDSFTDSVKDEFFCYAAGNYSTRTSCLQRYGYEDANSALSELKAFESTWTTDDSCYTGITPQHVPLEFQLQMLGTVPDEIDASTAYSESKSYFAAWRAMEKFERYCEMKYIDAPNQLGKKITLKAAVEDPDIFEEILPGWQTQRVWYAHELWAENKGYVRMPLGVLARKTGTRHLLFVVRRPLTNYEARAGWENGLTGLYLHDFPGGIHDGSGGYRGQLHATFMKYMRDWMKEVKDGGTADADSITLVGADFPGTGIAVGLGINIAKMRGRILGQHARTKVNVITFGNPYYGDRDLTEFVHSNLNARHIQVEGDGAQPLPCPVNRACDERHLITRTGTETGVKSYYVRAPGYFRIPLSDLGKMNATWAHPAASLQLAAIRDCGYTCGLGFRACKSDAWVQHNCNECESWIDM